MTFQGIFHLHNNGFITITSSQAGPQLVPSIITRQTSFPYDFWLNFLQVYSDLESLETEWFACDYLYHQGS